MADEKLMMVKEVAEFLRKETKAAEERKIEESKKTNDYIALTVSNLKKPMPNICFPKDADEDDDMIRFEGRTPPPLSEGFHLGLGQPGLPKLGFNKYFVGIVEAGCDNALVWRRVIAGKQSDPSLLAVGYENSATSFGEEGVGAHHNTPLCSRTAFLSGGTNGDLPTRVSSADYNHIYVDFRRLQEDVPYMLNCHFFDFIIIGAHTFKYMTRKSTVRYFAGMLSNRGVMLLPLNYDDSTRYSLSTIFPAADFCIDYHLVDRVFVPSKFFAEMYERIRKRGKDPAPVMEINERMEMTRRAQTLADRYNVDPLCFCVCREEAKGREKEERRMEKKESEREKEKEKEKVKVEEKEEEEVKEKEKTQDNEEKSQDEDGDGRTDAPVGMR